MIRIDLRLRKKTLDKVKELTRESEDMTQSDMLRELVELGLAMKAAKEKNKSISVSPVEKAILTLLYRTMNVGNYTFQQTFDPTNLPVDSAVEGVKQCAADAHASVLKQIEDWSTAKPDDENN